MLEIVKDQLMANWLVCRLTPSRKSAQYGIRFSYPFYISMVAIGIILINPYILSITALIAFFGVMLPMHPFDYLYNYGLTKLINTDKIPSRGSELQVNSGVSLVFNLGVIASIIYKFQLNYELMALIYIVSSIFFIVILLLADDFSIYSIYSFFFNHRSEKKD
jgi:CDP-diglyceride synthetase